MLNCLHSSGMTSCSTEISSSFVASTALKSLQGSAALVGGSKCARLWFFVRRCHRTQYITCMVMADDSYPSLSLSLEEVRLVNTSGVLPPALKYSC